METRSPTSDFATPGRVIAGKYRLETLIGQGGMGSVWAATHLGLNSRVAVKLVSRELVRSADALRRFDAEAKAVARLQSRHAVQVFDNGTLDDGTPYIAMEFLQGESINDRLRRTGPVPLAEAVAILGQCCKALGRAHAVGIVHRDIKPDNLYLALSHDDDTYVVKVLDFGIAKVTYEEGEAQSSTRTGMVLGTPLFMSPEQARGLKTIDHRTDLYSLGLVAFMMLTGKLAFSSDAFGDLLLQICTQPLPSIRAAAPWLPLGMEGWFQRVCAREPGDRCQSAQEFAESLRVAAGLSAADASGGHLPVDRASGAAGSPHAFIPGAPNVAPPLFDSGLSGPRPHPMLTQAAPSAAAPYAATRPAGLDGAAPPPTTPAYGQGPQAPVGMARSAGTDLSMLRAAGVPRAGRAGVIIGAFIAAAVLAAAVSVVVLRMQARSRAAAGPGIAATTGATAPAVSAPPPPVVPSGPGASTPPPIPSASSSPAIATPSAVAAPVTPSWAGTPPSKPAASGKPRPPPNSTAPIDLGY
ncbi:MAG TPA: serine/threonine-protein kinase [Polyangiaceae bacterium]|jgi:serine/threonine-protein kinase